jgi:CRISPR-associated protein Csb2
MPSHLCLSITFLGPTFHGQRDRAEPEWPPSPLRLFQALVAASAARWRDAFLDHAAPALRWLEAQGPPLIVTPKHHTGVPVRIAVPNNDMDVPAGFWARRVEPPENKAPQRLKTMKTVHPTWMVGEQPMVHYLWGLPEPVPEHVRGVIETLSAVARDVVALGWGVDLVAGHGRVLTTEEAAVLPGVRWRPTAEPTPDGLRVPTPGALDALTRRHDAFLHRLDRDGFTPPPAFTTFRVFGYRRDTDVAGRLYAAFELRTPDLERFRPFDPVRRTPEVAGMVRHAVAELARHMRPFAWTDADINTFIHGHTPDGNDRARGDDADRRFTYLPLPSLEQRHGPGRVAGMVRRLLVVGPPEHADAVRWVRVLSGQELVRYDDPSPVAALRLIDRSALALRNDPNLGPYVGESAVWSTVTPVVLPGYDDPDHLRRRLKDVTTPEAKRRLHERLDARIDGLLRKAIIQAGLSATLARYADLSWRLVGFRPGLDLATRYASPKHIQGKPRYHVRVYWRDAAGARVKVRGPLVLGAGRYCGLGLFARDE